jgi:hypothetical protein
LPASGTNNATLADDGTAETTSQISGSTFVTTTFGDVPVTVNKGPASTATDNLTINAHVDHTNSLSAGTAGGSLNSITAASINQTGAGAGVNLSATNIDLNTAAPTTTNGQVYNGTVTLGADLTVAANGAVTFGAINSDATPRSLTINNAGTTTFNGLVGGGAALTSLTTDAGGSTVINTATISTSGAQSYGDNVTLSANATLASSASGNISFGGTVNGAFSLNINTTGTTSLGTVGNSAPLTSIQTDGPGTLSLNGTITTTGAQTYNDPVTLAGATTRQHRQRRDHAGQYGQRRPDADINTDSATVLGGAIGHHGLYRPGTSASGTTAINGDSVRTSGVQSYG